MTLSKVISWALFFAAVALVASVSIVFPAQSESQIMKTTRQMTCWTERGGSETEQSTAQYFYKKHGELQVFTGILSENATLALYLDLEDDSWSLLTHGADGSACFIMGGDDWSEMAPTVPKPFVDKIKPDSSGYKIKPAT